ncbi:hypothetical protein AB0D45_05435 [Streptomyces sp. NPDC048352]|uniref:hypothetical protein n=1 Tax=Streptomyces sp. NPDC048352 TaxID=3154718 RepID=UPI0034463B03
MSLRQTVKIRRGAAVVMMAVLAVTLAGCGSSDDGKQGAPPKASESQPQGTSGASSQTAGQTSAPVVVIATLKGQQGVVLEVTSAKRDAGGYLTVSGQIRNTGAETFTDTVSWRGVELNGSGESVAGATFVDKAGKKRYYVLRDTESRCLCTSGVSSVAAGQTIPFFAQFPSPPTSTTEIEFSLPTFATATVKLSG